MGTKWDKFVLLMWKNWVLQYRRPLQTIIEILAPVFFSILLVLIRSLVDPNVFQEYTFQPFCIINVPQLCTNENISDTNKLPIAQFDFSGSNLWNLSLVYSPRNTKIDEAMNYFRRINLTVIGYNNSVELEEHFVTAEANTTLAAIQFSNDLYEKNSLPKDLEMVIRFPGELRVKSDIFGQNNWRTYLLYPVYQIAGPREYDKNYGATPQYHAEGFLTLQALTTFFLILAEKNITSNDILKSFNDISKIIPPMLKMQRFPHPSWYEDPLLQALESFVSLIIMLSFVYPCINTVKMITAEKEKQLKESMKIMGLPCWLHWLAWFVKTFIFLFISVILMVILLKISWYPNTSFSVFTYANPLVMLLFLVLYICATITFCFVISVFFSKANTAATIAGLLWFLSYALYLFLQKQYDSLNLFTKIITSLGSNTAMAYGFQLMLMFEGSSEGIQWNNIWKTNTPDDNLTLGLVMFMLIFDCILYLLIALYIEAIFPGEYGVPQPWYFPFTASYWWGHPRYVGVEESEYSAANKGEFFEAEPSNLQAGIQIRNLRKLFNKRIAVTNLSLNMYENQITVLLGHNGAGKTTTMSMLTGMFPSSQGTAIVGGFDIRTNMDQVRGSLGLCPQHNIIFDDLTVWEHLYFFSRLKGLKEKEEIKREINNYIDLLELKPKTNAKSSTLSGGMKRKLCVGIALCGNSKVVMLDEPTAGMDPSARRSLWSLLKKEKKGRTILLTTHFMDEADLLGDRIAIMAAGQLQCCGSSFFLKKKYGTGYHLIMDKTSQCDPNEVTQLLRRHISNIEIETNIGSELSYLLDEKQSSVFEQMLYDLETNSENLGIQSYGISLTTLEEVFMKVGAERIQEEEQKTEIAIKKPSNNILTSLFCLKRPKSRDTNSQETKLTIGNSPSLSKIQLMKNQFLAMLMKKILSTLRTWILQAIQILMPVTFLVIAIVVNRNQDRLGDLPKLPLSLKSYDKPVVIVQDEVNSNYSSVYKQIVSPFSLHQTTDVTETMLKLTSTNPSKVRMKYIVGASFLQDSIISWFNNDPYHSPPLALALILNTIYKINLGGNRNIKYANHPLPYQTNTKIKQLLSGNNMGFQLAFNIGFSMAFVSSFYILFYVKERVSKSKHLQFVSGVKIYIFWLTSFLCDLLMFIITIFALIFTLVLFQEEGFKTIYDIGRLFVILLYFGVAMLPIMYFASFLFSIPSTGYTRMTLFSIFSGVGAFLVIQVLLTPGLDLEYVARTLHWIFLMVPHYSLATGIRDTYVRFVTNKICKYIVNLCVQRNPGEENFCWYTACYNSSQIGLHDYCCERTPYYFKWQEPGIGRNLLYSFGLGTLLFLLLIIKEYNFIAILIKKLINSFGKHKPLETIEEDSDVTTEKQKIRHTPESQLKNEYTLILKDLTKYYKNFLAVNSLCLGVKKYECFGLLGINGAGKTSTFKMMTGDTNITYGNGWINGQSIKTQLSQVQKQIGYCPQFDALLVDLTARESLKMFCLLRGVPWEDCRQLEDKLAKDFDFSKHLNKKVNQLSGGNKRKLSTAIAMIGNPAVIYLDEPTTGMDPATKRYLWNALCQVRDSGKCIVLTSHSMEECEALCTRLAIMVNGQFQCLGSTQHLKNKFAEGYTLTIKIRKSNMPNTGQEQDIYAIETFIKQHFRNVQIREKHQELLTYYISDKSIAWSKMFGILEKAKKQLNIEDYSLGQSSLEQVFLTFTKMQR